MNNSKESRLVKRAIKKYKWDILKVWTLKILFLITSLSSMYISGLYINVLVTGVNWNLILKYMLVLAGLIIWEIMFNYWNVMRYYQTQANLVFYINYYVLKHIKRIRLSFFDDKDPAYLNQRVNEDINSIVNYKLDLICNMSISVLSFITIIGILSRVEWKLAVITILSIPLYLLLYFYNDKKLCSATFEYKERQNMFFACMNRQLSRPRLVKIKSLFETLDQELKNEYPSFFNALYRYYKCNYVFSSMIEVLGKGYNIFLFIYCAVGIYNKSITIGEFVIIKNYYTMLLQASTQIIAILKTYPNMLVSKKRLNEMSNEEDMISEQCMVFHIGSYMKNKMNTLTKFQWADLDCEYNRNMNDPKMMRSDRKIIPDLVIHRRRSNRNNLLVIEFKKKNAETYDKENDRNKLMYLTDQKEDFKYNFGLFVELGSHEVYMEVYQEGNLQTKLNYSITY